MAAPMRDEISRGAAVAVLAALLAFVTTGHLAWLAADSSLSGYDELAFFDHLTKYQTLLREGSFSQWLGFLDFSSYPALPFIAGTVAMKLGRANSHTVRLTGPFFHLVWILAAYGVGRRLAGRLAGLVAATATALGPLATVLARHYASFLPHAALSTLAVYTLLYISGADGWKRALICGIACSLALLAERGTPVLFLAGPLLWAAASRLWGTGRRSKQRVLLDFVLFAVVVALLTGHYLVGFVRANLSHTVALSIQAVNPGRDAGYYIERLRPTLLGPAFFPLLLVAVVLGAWRRDRRLLLPLFWLGVPLCVLSALATKDMVYALSMTSPLAVAAGVGAALLPRRAWRWPVLVVLLAFALLGWVHVGDPSLPLARATEVVRFAGLHDPDNLPIDHVRHDFDEAKLIDAVRAMTPATDEVWVFTGTPVDENGSAARKDLGDALHLLMLLHEVPGRRLVALYNLFPGRVVPVGEDQHLVLASADLAPPGSTAAFLARPAFAPDEHRAVEPKLAQDWADVQVKLVRVMGLGLRRLYLYRAVPPSAAAPAVGQPHPVAAVSAQ